MHHAGEIDGGTLLVTTRHPWAAPVLSLVRFTIFTISWCYAIQHRLHHVPAGDPPASGAWRTGRRLYPHADAEAMLDVRDNRKACAST